MTEHRTLAETRSELGYVQGQIEGHSGCMECTLAKRPSARCQEWLGLQAKRKQLKDDIAHWSDPGPDDETLF